MLSEKIENLKGEVVDYASLVEQMIENSIKGLMKKDGDVLEAIIEESEPRANEREIDIEEKCVSLIAQFEPKAKDLRVILMILKMNNDLERMADNAVHIADSALFLIERQEIKPSLDDIPELSEKTIEMLNDGITSFINEDASLARSVCERDNSVDDLRGKMLRDLIGYMMKEPEGIERLLHVERISKKLERIADLSTNICEDVIYMVKGKVIKHHLENGR